MLTDLPREMITSTGERLLAEIEALDMTPQQLAERMDLSAKHITEVIQGKTPLTDEFAQRLERVLCVAASFWMNFERSYRQRLAAADAREHQAEEVAWSRTFDLKTMYEIGILPVPKDKKSMENAEGLFRFFGVATPAAYQNKYGDEVVAARLRLDTAAATEERMKALPNLALWLRYGELAARASFMDTANSYGTYSESAFKKILATCRKLAHAHPPDFQAQLKDACLAAGVTVVFTPDIKGAPISGAAWWRSAWQPVIQLSDRYKHNDRFWFTFFHEAAHILLHKDKKAVILDPLPNEAAPPPVLRPEEREANDFAANWLIHPKVYELIKTAIADCPNNGIDKGIVTIAKQHAMHPALLVGRLQHDGFIPQSVGTRHKERVVLQPSSIPEVVIGK